MTVEPKTMKKQSAIPTFSLQERNQSGLEVRKIGKTDMEKLSLLSAHRDNHYIFFFQEQGCSKMMVDFKEMAATGAALLAVLPGQVHYGISVKNIKGWFVALDTSLINENFRPILNDIYTDPAPILLTDDDAALIRSGVLLLYHIDSKKGTGSIYTNMLHGAIDTFVGLVTTHYLHKKQLPEQPTLRVHTITKQFRSLLMISFRIMKSPSSYADALNLSPSYLNEAVKQVTGNPVSYWIQQEILLEAKRMLFYTENTVKEIAHGLGYQDHTYFIRLFSKTEGIPPLQFRQRYRK